MSKLKRKKCVPDKNNSGPNLKQFIIGAPKSLRSSDDTSPSEVCSRDIGPWWTSDLTEVEKLWMTTLQAYCPVFSSSDTSCCIPDLPQTPANENIKLRWCSLDENVSELPAFNDPAGCVPIVCQSPHLTPNQRNHQSKHLTKTKNKQQILIERNLDNCPQDTASLRKWTNEPDLVRDACKDSKCKQDEKAVIRSLKVSQKSGRGESSGKITPGCTGNKQTHGADCTKLTPQQVWMSEEQENKRNYSFEQSRLECNTETKVGSSNTGPKPGMTNLITGAESGPALKSAYRASWLESDTACRPETSRGGSGCGLTERKLESCPMCLMPFPAGFSQMDCDGHLAQCLSEMNTDVMW